MSSLKPVVRLVNAVEPVTPLYRHLIPALVRDGYAVEILMSKTAYRPERDSLESSLGNIDNVKIKYGPRHYRSGIRRIFSTLRYHLWVARKALTGPVPSLAVYLTQPPLIAWWGRVSKRRRKARYIVYSMDIYPDVAVKAGILKPGKLTNWLARRSKSIYRDADAVISIGRCMIRRLQDMGVDDEKIKLVPNWVDGNIIFPVHPSENRMRKNLNLVSKPVLLYSGNLGHSHSLTHLVEVLADPNIGEVHLLVIGGGVGLPNLKKQITERELGNVHFLPFQPESRLAESQSAGDVHFVSLEQQFEGLVVPSKAYGALAAHRPLLYYGPRTSEIAKMILDEGIGWVVEPGNLSSLRDAVSEMKNAKKIDRLAENSRKIFEEKYHSDKQVGKILRLIDGTINKKLLYSGHKKNREGGR